MSLIYTSDWMFYRRLSNLKRLLDDRLISQEMYEQDRQRAMEWRGDRLYGKPPALPSPSRSKPVTKKQTKPAITSQPAESPPAANPQAGDEVEATKK